MEEEKEEEKEKEKEERFYSARIIKKTLTVERRKIFIRRTPS